MTRIDQERIASLANHPGFKALLKLLDEADEILLIKLESASGDKETELLNLWRASRRFKKLIEHQPDQLYAELGNNINEFVS